MCSFSSTASRVLLRLSACDNCKVCMASRVDSSSCATLARSRSLVSAALLPSLSPSLFNPSFRSCSISRCFCSKLWPSCTKLKATCSCACWLALKLDCCKLVWRKINHNKAISNAITSSNNINSVSFITYNYSGCLLEYCLMDLAFLKFKLFIFNFVDVSHPCSNLNFYR